VETQDSPDTRASLLIRLRDRTDQSAWNEFVTVYGPVIYRFARNRGLQDADAADMMQDVLRSVTGAINRLEYDPQRGRFRGWLFTITRNRVLSLLASRKGRPQGTGHPDVNALLAAQPDQRDGLDEDWELEYRRSQTALAIEEVRTEFTDKVWSAFWKTAVDARSADETGRELGMSSGAVYVAKSRVLARLREVVQRRLTEDEERN